VADQWTPYTYFRELVRAGVDFDAFGVQIYAPYRDLLDSAAMLERYEALGKPVVITELGVPSEPVTTHAWTPEQQADWAEQMYTVLMPRSGVAGVLWYDFVDVEPFLPGGGLLGADCSPKPAYDRIERLLSGRRLEHVPEEAILGEEQRRLPLEAPPAVGVLLPRRHRRAVDDAAPLRGLPQRPVWSAEGHVRRAGEHRARRRSLEQRAPCDATAVRHLSPSDT
jgi:hypothetical protein